MVDKAKDLIPDFLKDGAKNVMEPLGKLEKAIDKAREKVSKNVEKVDAREEIKKVFDDLQGRVRTARNEAEKVFNTGLTKTFGALNLPTKKEVSDIRNQLAALAKTVDQLKKKTTIKKAAKPKKAAKKAPVKKAAKKTVKKAAKKPVKKTAKKAIKKTAKKGKK